MHHILPNGKKENGLFIDGEHFDWGIDSDDLTEVMNSGDENLIRMAQASINEHYLDSLSEFVGRHITPKDINEAEKTGWI